MHRIFLILMIALLPLRGWVGDVMAAQMASQTLVQVAAVPLAAPEDATETVAAHAHDAGASDHFHAEITPAMDCAGHAGGDSNAATNNTHCSTCGVCQVCHTVALTLSNPVASPTAIALWVPPYSSTRFTSADLALGLKPPIS